MGMGDLIERGVAMKAVRCAWLATEALEKIPAVDAVKVVRCKDCEHSKKLFSYEGSYSSYCLICSSKGSVVFLNDFCSCGERQTNGLK